MCAFHLADANIGVAVGGGGGGGGFLDSIESTIMSVSMSAQSPTQMGGLAVPMVAQVMPSIPAATPVVPMATPDATATGEVAPPPAAPPMQVAPSVIPSGDEEMVAPASELSRPEDSSAPESDMNDVATDFVAAAALAPAEAIAVEEEALVADAETPTKPNKRTRIRKPTKSSKEGKKGVKKEADTSLDGIEGGAASPSGAGVEDSDEVNFFP